MQIGQSKIIATKIRFAQGFAGISLKNKGFGPGKAA
jgi:hypothetical protein